MPFGSNGANPALSRAIAQFASSLLRTVHGFAEREHLSGRSKTWAVEKDMFSMGLFHLSNMDLSLDTKRGKHKVGRILLYVTMQLARNWIDMAFHSVDLFRMWQLCLLLLFCKNGHMHKQASTKTATCTNKHPSPESCWKNKSLHLIILRLSGSEFIELFGPPAAWANARQELTGNLDLL